MVTLQTSSQHIQHWVDVDISRHSRHDMTDCSLSMNCWGELDLTLTRNQKNCEVTDLPWPGWCLQHKVHLGLHLHVGLYPANTKHLHNICTKPAQRLRRWSNFVQMLHKCFIPANTKHLYNFCTTPAQRRRRWSNFVRMLHKCFISAHP